MKVDYRCPNGCTLPKLKKRLMQDASGNFSYGYQYFNYCPYCGAPMPYTKTKLQDFLDVFKLHPALKKAERLLVNGEFEAAVREAVVVLENAIKAKANLPDARGKDLAAQALKMKYDKQANTIVEPPIIALNDLKTESQRNEQEGIMYMLMGFFQGPRNLFQHNSIGTSVNMIMSIVFEASFFLYLIEGENSMLKNGYQVKSLPRKYMNICLAELIGFVFYINYGEIVLKVNGIS